MPADVDHWSLLGALKEAGIGLVRLIVPPRRSHAPTAFPGAAPLLDKVTVGERDELAAALADVVIVDDLRAVPDGFPGLAVTREGEFYRPSAGQLGLAGGLPAALLLERRAALEGLRERLDALRAREARESAAWTKARQAREDAVAASRAAEQEERAARIAAEEAGRELAELTSRLRDLEDTLARARRSSEALAAEAAEALAGKEAGRRDRRRRSACAPNSSSRRSTEAEAAVAAAESRVRGVAGHGDHACRVELEERRAAARAPPRSSAWRASAPPRRARV